MQTIVSFNLISSVTSYCAAFSFVPSRLVEQRVNKSQLYMKKRNKETYSKNEVVNKLCLEERKNLYLSEAKWKDIPLSDLL